MVRDIAIWNVTMRSWTHTVHVGKQQERIGGLGSSA